MSIDVPPVVGDPAGMRALAAELRSSASKLASLDHGVWGHVSSMRFTGPAATRVAGVIRTWHGDVSGAAQRLNDTAGLLERSATTVEGEQIARARLIRQLQEEAQHDRGSAP